MRHEAVFEKIKYVEVMKILEEWSREDGVGTSGESVVVANEVGGQRYDVMG